MTHVEIQKFPIAGDGFTIARETKTDANVVYVELHRNGFHGSGECVPLKRYGHSTESIHAEITQWLSHHPEWSREKLIATMPSGPARFALDTALWQLEAAEHGVSFADYLRPFLDADPATIDTAFTLGGAPPEKMAALAATKSGFRWLKIKLMGDGLDQERLDQIHAAAPDTDLIVDANESLSPEMLTQLLPVFHRNRVVLIEQPLPEKNDEALRHIDFPVPFAADESCHDATDLPTLVGKYDIVNIKLDKAGGLTHALDMKRRAHELGFGVMVGCMASTWLSILPAFFLAQGAVFADLDGALLLVNDRADSPLSYRNHQLSLL